VRPTIALALAAAAALLASQPASAEVRTATVRDGVDPTLQYDIARIRAKLDRTAGTLRLSVRLHRPFPTATENSWIGGISVAAYGRSSVAGDCRYGTDTVGATRLLIDTATTAPTPELPEIHVAETLVSYRQAWAATALRISADRLTATVTVTDELLRGADLRCVSAQSTGRAVYDPRQPGGGPSIEQPFAGYFAGFSPKALLRKALARCDRPPPRQAKRGPACCLQAARPRPPADLIPQAVHAPGPPRAV
jgi:hypothetical protein